MIAVDAHALTLLGRHIGTGGQLLQILVHLIGQNSRELDLTIGTYHDHRGNPLHAIGLGDVGLFKFLQLAHLRIGDTELLDSFLPSLHIGIHRHTDELDAVLFVCLLHAHHLGGILTTVRAPRCPEVEHHRLTLRKLRELEFLTIDGLHLEVGCHTTGLDQFRCILRVHVFLRTELRFYFCRCSHQKQSG